MDTHAPALSHHVAQKQRILLIVVGALLAALAIFAMSLVFFSKKDLEPYVTKVALQQQEVLRVNKLVSKFAPTLAIRQTQSTLAAIVASDYAQVLAARQKLSKEPISKAMAAQYTDSEAETRFQSAAQSNSLEREYRDTLIELIEGNQASLRELSAQTNKNDLEALVNQISDHNTFLVTQLNSR